MPTDRAVQDRLALLEADKIPLDFYLEAQQRRDQVENDYNQTIVDNDLRKMQVDAESGNLLNRYGMSFSDIN